MKRSIKIALAVFGINLALVLLFPPYDYLSLQRNNVPTFDGFYFLLGDHPNRRLNSSFLTLEILVVLINLSIFWLLTRDRELGKPAPAGNHYQRAILLLVAANLLLVLLFPPFQNYTSLSKAALPSFEGFYFIFGDNSQRQLVSSILYIEVAFILANGALLWLILKGRSREKLSTDDIRNLARTLQATQREKP